MSAEEIFRRKFPKYKMTPMEAARREEHRILRKLFFDGWLDRNGHSYRYRWEEDYAKGDIAVRLASTKIRIYDCWLPDPDDEDCAIHLLIDEDDLEKRLVNAKNLPEVIKSIGCFVGDFKNMPMYEKLDHLCSNLDIIEFLELEDVPEGTPWNEVKLKNKLPKDIYRVKTLDDTL